MIAQVAFLLVLTLGAALFARQIIRLRRGLAMALQVLDDLRYEHDNGRNLWSMTCAL